MQIDQSINQSVILWSWSLSISTCVEHTYCY